jgi:hypothetical protein
MFLGLLDPDLHLDLDPSIKFINKQKDYLLDKRLQTDCNARYAWMESISTFSFKRMKFPFIFYRKVGYKSEKKKTLFLDLDTTSPKS